MKKFIKLETKPKHMDESMMELDKLAGSRPDVKPASKKELEAYILKELYGRAKKAKKASKKELEAHILKKFPPS